MACDWFKAKVIQVVVESVVRDISIHDSCLMLPDRNLPEERKATRGKASRKRRCQHQPRQKVLAALH